jgi:Spy/CpxP family protein refolding chaperone
MLSTGAINAAQIPDPAADQKEAIGHMHHQLHNDQAPYKAQEAQALKELNEMTIREDVELEDVNTKIDELMAAKNQIMRLRYSHLIEMRTILTDEQKPGYDKNILKRSAVK